MICVCVRSLYHNIVFLRNYVTPEGFPLVTNILILSYHTQNNLIETPFTFFSTNIYSVCTASRRFFFVLEKKKKLSAKSNQVH